MSEMLSAGKLVDKNGVQLEIMDAAARAAAAENQRKISELTEEMGKQDKPRVYIDGAIPTTKDDVLAELTYQHGPERWHAYITIKCQGTSSMSYPKKNFTIKLYSDEARKTKLKKQMFGWPKATHKYVLKANWIDHSHARNIVTARLWGEVVASRPDYDNLPEELRTSPNNGAIDGYPIIVYTNGSYQGVYTWNVGKDDWMWGMDEDNKYHVLLCAETNTDGIYRATPCNFRSLWSGMDGQDWSVEVGANGEAVKNSLNALISCVMDTDDATFRATIGNHLDVQSAIDYYLLTCADCGIDNLAKNMLMGTYNLQKWYCGKYDLDSTWLLYWDGSRFIAADTPCPMGYQEKFSLLWSRLRNVFWREMKSRGHELRKTVLTYANIMGHFERFCEAVGKEAYADDLVAYPGIPSAETNDIWQLRNAVRDRLAYFDSWLEAIQDGVSCTGITISQSEATVGVGESIMLTANVIPGNTTDEVRWSSSDNSVAWSQGTTGYVGGQKDGVETITVICGKQTATCVVTVGTGAPEQSGVLYELPQATIFSGVKGESINTNVDITTDDQDFTVAIDFTPNETVNNVAVISGYSYDSSYTKYVGLEIIRRPSWVPDYWFVNIMNGDSGASSRHAIDIPMTSVERCAVVVRHTGGTGKYIISSVVGNGELQKAEVESAHSEIEGSKASIFIGAAYGDVENYFSGTIHRCTIYSRAFTDDEVTAFVNGMTD